MKCSVRFAFVPLVFLSLGIQAEDWPKWRGPDENGIAREALPENPALGNVVWKKKIGAGYSSFAVVGDHVYATGHDGGKERIFCFDVETGEQIWGVEYGAKLLPRLHKGGPSASPVVDDGLLYTISKDGLMLCLDAKAGTEIWRVDLKEAGGIKKPAEWGYAASPYILGNLVIAESGKTFALDKKTGKKVWEGANFGAAYGSPAVLETSGRKDLVVLKEEGIVIQNGETGETLATEKWETSFATNSTTPDVFGNQIFISTGYKRGCALFNWDGAKLTKVYENKLLSNHMNNSVLVDGVMCGFDGNAHMGKPTEFVGVELATGKEVFRVSKNEGLGCGSLIADKNGKLLILSERGELVLATAGKAGFEILDREQILGGRLWTAPVLSAGRVFARNAEGDFVCVKLDE